MNKIVSYICFLFLISNLSFAFDTSFSKEGATDFYNPLKHRSGNIWKYGRSSFLLEDNDDKTRYEHCKIWDNDIETAWVEGIPGNGINEWVIIDIDGDYQYLDYEDAISDKQLLIKMTINNGFCKNKKTFQNNNRVKKAKITIFEAPLHSDENERYIIENPFENKSIEIELKDEMKEQIFNFSISPNATVKNGMLSLFLKLTILDVYSGKKSQDTCISELKATAEVVE